MAEYKVVDATQLDADLTAVADAIRERAGTHVKIEFPKGFASAIRNIPGDVGSGEEIEVESLSQVHYWTKTGKTGGIINETYQSNGTTIGYMNETVQYADEVTLEGDNLVLVNPRDYTVTSDDDAAEEVLVGKYIYALSNFYRIPSDAVIIYYSASQYVAAHLNANKVYKLSVTPGTEEQVTIVVSENSAAYPENGEQDGFTYVYQGVVGTELPALSNPGTASDVAKGKQLINENGNVVTGTLTDGGNLSLVGGTPGIHFSTDGGSGVVASANADTDRILRAGDKVSIVTAYDQFGDATAANVAKGKTFTSAAGLKVTGTHECEEGVTLPKLTNPASATDLALDKQLIDADGNVVTGTIREVAEPDAVVATYWPITPTFVESSQTLRFEVSHGTDVLARKNTKEVILSDAVGFGDATAADVAEGKTFTSAAGLKVVGTASGGGFTVTDDGDGNVTITSSAITDTDGNVVIA